MFFRRIFVIAVSAPLLLIACGPENALKPESQGFTKTFHVPIGKDQWHVEMLIKSFTIANDKQSAIAFYEQIEPIVIDAIKADAPNWDKQSFVSSDTSRPTDLTRTAHGKTLCERIKEDIHKHPGVPIMSDCLMISLVKI